MAGPVKECILSCPAHTATPPIVSTFSILRVCIDLTNGYILSFVSFRLRIRVRGSGGDILHILLHQIDKACLNNDPSSAAVDPKQGRSRYEKYLEKCVWDVQVSGSLFIKI